MTNLKVLSLPPRALSATRVAFLLPGIAMGAWAPLVPYARERAGIEDAELGILLLGLGGGSMLMMPIAGWLVGRLGCRLAMCLASSAIAVCLVMLSSLSSFGLLMLFLVLFGGALGIAEVTMNMQGSIVERSLARSMMSGFHGLFSLGAILSAGTISGLLWMGASPLQAILLLLAISGAALVAYQRHMLPYGEVGGSGGFARPTGTILLLGGLCFIAFLVEGSLLDWSAIFLTRVRQVDMSQAGLGYAVFSVTMALGRLNGDRIVRRLGPKVVLMAGTMIAIAGMSLAVSLDHWTFALLGFVLVGVGIANMVPVFCSLAGRQQRMPVGLALATITAIGYLGILLGPALIGFVSQAIGLSATFMGVACLLLLIAGMAPVITRKWD
ncbi:MFS transporter [Pseudomonas knackmussii]|uniref:MFS transporter n=1 Tax=Pseudomonas knackmussii TaxID=65741 RepID=UPI003F4A5435